MIHLIGIHTYPCWYLHTIQVPNNQQGAHHFSLFLGEMQVTHSCYVWLAPTLNTYSIARTSGKTQTEAWHMGTQHLWLMCSPPSCKEGSSVAHALWPLYMYAYYDKCVYCCIDDSFATPAMDVTPWRWTLLYSVSGRPVVTWEVWWLGAKMDFYNLSSMLTAGMFLWSDKDDVLWLYEL